MQFTDASISCLRPFSRLCLYLLVTAVVLLLLLVLLDRDGVLILPQERQQSLVIIQSNLHNSNSYTRIVSSNVTFSLSPSVTIRPERFDTVYISPEVYMSILTTPKHHPTRFSLQLLTWMQTFNPKQVNNYISKITNMDDYHSASVPASLITLLRSG